MELWNYDRKHGYTIVIFDTTWLINRDIWTSNNAFSGGHNLQTGHIPGIHTLEITLKENVTCSDFVKFYKEAYIPDFERYFSGIQLYFLRENWEKVQEKMTNFTLPDHWRKGIILNPGKAR
jgi:hypothetical protein